MNAWFWRFSQRQSIDSDPFPGTALGSSDLKAIKKRQGRQRHTHCHPLISSL